MPDRRLASRNTGGGFRRTGTPSGQAALPSAVRPPRWRLASISRETSHRREACGSAASVLRVKRWTGE